MVTKIGIDYSGESVLGSTKVIKKGNRYEFVLPRNDPPLFVAVAVLIDARELEKIHKAYINSVRNNVFSKSFSEKIIMKEFPSGRKIHVSQFYALHKYELHASDIIRQEGRKGWKNTTVEQRVNVLSDLIDELIKTRFSLIYSYINLSSSNIKEDLKKLDELLAYKAHIIETIGLQVKTALFERVFKEILKRDDKDYIILTDGGEGDLLLLKVLKEEGRFFSELYFDVFLSDKSVSIGVTDSLMDFSVQLADFFAYVVRRKLMVDLGYSKSLFSFGVRNRAVNRIIPLEDKVKELVDKNTVRSPTGSVDGYGKIEIKRIWRSL